jgi:dihydrofolate reductase
MKISMIVAMDEQNGIGKDNKLLWHLPEDMAHFKKTTTGKTVLMGRNTYESIGGVLPNRKNIIMTRQPTFAVAGGYVSERIEYVLKHWDEDIYVIGGQSIYKQFMPYADELIVTHVKGTYEADTHFPEIKPDIWYRTLINTATDGSFKIYKYTRKK